MLVLVTRGVGESFGVGVRVGVNVMVGVLVTVFVAVGNSAACTFLAEGAASTTPYDKVHTPRKTTQTVSARFDLTF